VHGVLDAVRAGDIPKKKANDLGIIVSVWLDPGIVDVTYDPEVLFQTNREAIGKAMRQGDAARAHDRLAPGQPGQGAPLFSPAGPRRPAHVTARLSA